MYQLKKMYVIRTQSYRYYKAGLPFGRYFKWSYICVIFILDIMMTLCLSFHQRHMRDYTELIYVCSYRICIKRAHLKRFRISAVLSFISD